MTVKNVRTLSSKKLRRLLLQSFLALNVISIVVIASYVIIISIKYVTHRLSLLSLPYQHLSPQQSMQKMRELDAYLNMSNSLTKKLNNKTRLIYPNEILEMTKTIIDKSRCSERYGDDLLLLVMVYSRVDDLVGRQTIRNTWAKDIKANANHARLYFALGLSGDQSVQNSIVEEDRLNADIIQWGFRDSYYNLTIKSLAILRWTALNCPNVKFLLKTDDDTIVISDNILNVCNNTLPDVIYGHLWRNPCVIRDQTSKFSLSIDDYPLDYYPNYVGGVWLIPGSAAMPLYRTAITESLPALPYEDAYITGIVAQKLNLPRKQLSAQILYLSDCDVPKLDYCWFNSFSIYWQKLNSATIPDTYRQITSTKQTCCAAHCWSLSLSYVFSLIKYYLYKLISGHAVCIYK